MSTENNLDKTFNSSVKILSDLIAFKSISGEDNSSLIDYCEKILNKLGAESFKTYDQEKKRVNLFATIKRRNFGFLRPNGTSPSCPIVALQLNSVNFSPSIETSPENPTRHLY